MISFELGSEIRWKALITDYNREKFDPDSQLITLYCETSSIVTGSPAKLATGEYYYSYQSTSSSPVGVWWIEWQITKGNVTTIKRERFLVVNTGSW